MNKNSKSDNYILEIKDFLDRLETILNESDDKIDGAGLKSIYTLIHKIDETSQLYGINSISNLFSTIEQNFSVKLENKQSASQKDVAIIISTISLSNSLLGDPSLKNQGLKSSYEALKKEITDHFGESSINEEADDMFSNSRFREIFMEEAYDLINQLEEKLLQLEGETEDESLIDNVFRIMHTLKGNSNMFGHTHLGEITHHLENVYDEIRSHKLEINRNILDITLQCIDHFRNLIDDPELADQTNKVIQESILNDIGEILSSGGQVSTQKEETIGGIAEDDNGIKSYYLFFNPSKNIFDDGTNPLYFIYDLNDIGECLTIPVTSTIPVDDTFNPELCYTSWHIIIVSKESADAITDNFIFLREEDQPHVSIVSSGNVLANADFVASFKKQATSKKSIADKLKIVEVKKTIKEIKKVVKAKTQENSIASIRVAATKVDLMMNLISELVTKQAELSMLANDNDITQLQEVAESIESISRDLRDNAFSISLIPLEKSVLRFQRLVRDVSSKFGKKVEFVVEGKETELDKTIIEKIVDPIMHILRNSIDHGIETPEERVKLGKPEHGTITLKAYPSGAHVVIEISDDGSGINVEKVRKVAIRKGYIKEGDEFTTNDMLKLILQPGFSTTENVSEVSGRGVGMDVVNQKIMEIRGELDVQTESNVGTTMTIRLPLTISIIDSLLVMIGETYYLIPLSVVERCAEVQAHVITESPTNYINLDGEFIPFIDLHTEFDVEEERDSYQRLILVNHRNILVALVVDQIMGNHQAVLKSLGQMYRKQEIVSGASILGNGEVALVLDTNKLVAEYMVDRENEINKINLLNSQIQKVTE